MERIRPGMRLSRDFISAVRTLEQTDFDEFVIEHGDEQYLVRRRGACDFSRCGAACCQMMCLNAKWNEYLEGFAIQGSYSPLILTPCHFLQPDLTCKRWNGPDYPSICTNFPVPGDAMYLEVMDRCSFYFEMVNTILENRLEQLTS